LALKTRWLVLLSLYLGVWEEFVQPILGEEGEIKKGQRRRQSKRGGKVKGESKKGNLSKLRAALITNPGGRK